jgi:hypothetical protein
MLESTAGRNQSDLGPLRVCSRAKSLRLHEAFNFSARAGIGGVLTSKHAATRPGHPCRVAT